MDSYDNSLRIVKDFGGFRVVHPKVIFLSRKPTPSRKGSRGGSTRSVRMDPNPTPRKGYPPGNGPSSP